MFNLQIIGLAWVGMHHIPEDEGCHSSTAIKGAESAIFWEIRTNSVFEVVLNLSANREEVALTCSSLMSWLVGWPGWRLVGYPLGSFIIAVRWIHCWAITCSSVGVVAVVGLAVACADGCSVSWLICCNFVTIGCLGTCREWDWFGGLFNSSIVTSGMINTNRT